MNMKSKLAMIFVFVFMFVVVNHSLAFRATDSRDEMSSIKAVDPNSATSTGGIRLESKPKLKSVLCRNLNQPVQGDAVQAAKDIVQGLMSTGFVGLNRGQQSLSCEGPGITNNAQIVGFKSQLRKTQVDNLGYQHIRIAQTFQGLPVVGAEIIVHINNKDIIYQVNGKYLQDFKASVTPSIDADDALKVGMDEQKGKPGLYVSKEPSLVIYGTHLAYHYVLSHERGEGVDVGQWWYYVDAHTGILIHRYNNIKYGAPVEGSGYHTNVSGSRLTGEDGAVVTINGFYENLGSVNYFLYNFNSLWGIYDEDVPDWEQQPSSNWGTSDRAAVSCGKNYADTQTYVSNVLGRNSFDDAGALARANVHTGTNYVNAYWDGTDFHFGDGDGVQANELTVLDVAAHEYGHALTQHTSNLVYSYESGALNEAYSDIHGCTVEFYTQPDGTGSYPNATAGHDDWLIGEDCWLSEVALRDIRDPQRYELPSYYQGTYWYYGSGDNGGVHYNNGPACFAYYLLAVGGSGTNDGHPYGPITGIGEVNAAAVALRANYFYHTSIDQYIDARQHWISAAADLGQPTATVEDVWTAVGVGGGSGAGEVIQTWAPASNSSPWGIAYTSDGFVWVGDGWGSNYTYKYQANGTATGSSWSYTWTPSNGPADCAFNSNTGMVWTLDVGTDNCLHEMDPASGFTGNTICGPWSTSQRGLAYDPTTDTWFTGGWNDDTIYHINSSGTLLDSANVGLEIAGLAYNPNTQHLFVMENTALNNIIHVLDASDSYNVVGQFTVPFSDYGGAGLEIDPDKHLWAVDQQTDEVYQIRSGEEEKELISDASFENGPPPASEWTEWTDNGCEWIVDPSGAWGIPAYDGTYAYWACGYCCGAPSSDYVEQSIAIPAGATTLVFMANYYRPNADDPPDNDYFYVKINGTTLYSKALIQANDTYPNWTEETVDISAYAGQTVTLRFEGASAGSNTGNILIDYIRIASGGPAAGALPGILLLLLGD